MITTTTTPPAMASAVNGSALAGAGVIRVVSRTTASSTASRRNGEDGMAGIILGSDARREEVDRVMNQERAARVQGLFDEAAPDYDRVESLMAFGSGPRYRREALVRAGL